MTRTTRRTMGEEGSRASGWSHNQKIQTRGRYLDGGGRLRGPRVLILSRENGQQDFGFTLRHFIVYPPEEYIDESGISSGSQPMDTVFVKAVRPGTPAARAGLRTGDRLVAVQGAPVGGSPVEGGLSYAKAVRVIHGARDSLELQVVPQEYDLLQQYYHAHAPETNQRPNLSGPCGASPESARQHRSNGERASHSAWQQQQQQLMQHQQQQAYPQEKARVPAWDQQDSVAAQQQRQLQQARRHVEQLVYGKQMQQQQQQQHLQQQHQQQQQQQQQQQHHRPYTPSRLGPVPYGAHVMQQSNSLMPYSPQALYHQSEQLYDTPQQTSSRLLDHYEPSPRCQPYPMSPSKQQHGYGSSAVACRPYPAPWTSNFPETHLSYRPIRTSLTSGPPSTALTNYSPLLSLTADESTRRESSASLASSSNTDANSLSSYDSLSTVTNRSGGGEPDDSPMMNRLRKSFEQKEEFLRRPSQPTGWLPTTHESASPPNGLTGTPARKSDGSVIQQKEFYARPQKLRNTVWPPYEDGGPMPAMPGGAAGPMEGVTRNGNVRSSGGNSAGPQLPVISPVSKMREITAMDSQNASTADIEETDKIAFIGLQTVSTLSRQFESGRPLSPEGIPEDRTSLYRSELSRLSWEKAVPHVSVRRKEFESRAKENEREGRRRESRSVESSESPMEAVPMRVRSHSAESQTTVESRRSHRIRPESYIAAQKEPAVTASVSTEAIYETIPSENIPPVKPPRMRDLIKMNTDNTEEIIERPMSAPPRPTHLPLDAASSERDAINDTVLNGVIRRKKVHSVAVDDSPMDYNNKMRDIDPNVMQDPQAQQLQSEENASKTVDKEGPLSIKIITLDKKRTHGRSWRTMWVQIQGSKLFFYQKGSHQTPESFPPLELGSASVDVAADYTKRRHVLRFAAPGAELLLQAEGPADMRHWLRAMHDAGAKVSASTEGLDEVGAEGSGTQQAEPQSAPAATSVPHKPSRKFPQFRSRSPTGQSPVNKTRKATLNASSTNDQQSQQQQGMQLLQQPAAAPQTQSGSPKTKTWKGRVARQLRRMQGAAVGGSGGQSPTSPGAESGRCIGVPMELCPPSADNPFVPRLVDFCTGVVEARGLDVMGIYRVPGNTAAVQALTNMASRGLTEEDMQDPRWNDVNVISSLLKSFFRRLPDSLLTADLYPLLIAADKSAGQAERLVALRSLLRQLPRHHYETLQHLMRHLRRVVCNSAINKMEARNLAIVFGPTLVKANEDSLATMVNDMSHQCRIVESVLNYVDWFFSPVESTDLPELIPEVVPEAPVTQTPPARSLLLENVTKVEAAAKKRQKVFSRTKTAPIPTTHMTNQNFIEISASSDGKSQRSDDTDCVQSFSDISNSEHLNSACSLTRVMTSTNSSSSHSSSTHSSTYHEETNGLLQNDKSESSAENRKSIDLNSGCSDLVSDIQSTFDRLLNSPTSLDPLSGPDNIPYADESPDKPHGSPSRLRDPSWHRCYRNTEEEQQSEPGPDHDAVDYASTSSTISSQQSCRSATSCGSNDTMDSLRSDRSEFKENDSFHVRDQDQSKSPNNVEVAAQSAEITLDGAKFKDFKNGYTGNFLLKSQSNASIPVNVVKPMASNSNNSIDNGTSYTINSPKQSTSVDYADEGSSKNATEQNQITENQESNFNVNITSNQTGTSLTLTSEGLYNDKSTTVTVKPGLLFRSESLNKHERTHSPVNKVKRSDSLNKKDDIKLKRSESLSKSEKTQTNYKTREMALSGKSNVKKDIKLKRKNGCQNKSIKRRHTVGGTKDYVTSQESEARKEQVRTSSPDLNLGTCARDSFLLEVRMRTPSNMIAEIRVSHNFLESHI